MKRVFSLVLVFRGKYRLGSAGKYNEALAMFYRGVAWVVDRTENPKVEIKEEKDVLKAVVRDGVKVVGSVFLTEGELFKG